MMKTTIQALQNEVNTLSDWKASNDRKQEDMGLKVSYLFSDAINELEQVDSQKSQPDSPFELNQSEQQTTMKHLVSICPGVTQTITQTRLTPHVIPKYEKVHDYHHPPKHQLDYKNRMVGVIYHPQYRGGHFNIIMSDGNNGSLKYNKEQEIKMTDYDELVSRIVVYQRDENSWMVGFRFYSKEGKVLLEVGDCSHPPFEFLLEENERVVGITSMLHYIPVQMGENPSHQDLQFVIGSLED